MDQLEALKLEQTPKTARSAVQTFNIAISDVNETPTISFATGVNVNEFVDTTGGLSLGAFSVNDADAGDTIAYSIVGGADSLSFAIGGVNNDELVIDAGVLDFETKSSFVVTVEGTDSGGLSDQWTVLVTVNNLNDAPQLIMSNVMTSINENTDTSSGIRVADLQVVDDALGTNLLNLTGADAGKFEIIGNQLWLRANEVLNYESQSLLDVTIELDDSAIVGLEDSGTVSLSVNDINEQPLGTSDQFTMDQLSSITLDPNDLTLNDSDPDGDGLAFIVDTTPANGTLVVQPDGTLRYTPDETFAGVDTFTYIVTDGQLSSSPIEIEIFVNPLAAPPPTVDPPVDDTDTTDSSDGDSDSDDGDSDNGSDEPTDQESPQIEDESPSEPTEGAISDTPLIPMINPNEKGGNGGQSNDGEAGEGQELVSVISTTGGRQVGAFQRVSTGSFGRIAHSSILVSGSTESSFSSSSFASAQLSVVPFSPIVNAKESLPEFKFESFAIGTSAVTTATLSVGYVIWLIRGGTLLTSFVSVMPAWTSFDPLPIVKSANEEDDSESLVDIVSPDSKA